MKKLSILLLSLAAMGAFAFVLPSLPTGQSGAYPTETAFMAEAEEMFQKGNKLYEQGYMLQANYYYGQAVVAVASLRYGLSELIYVKQRDERAAAKKAAEEKQRKEDEEDMEDWGWEDEGGLLTALTNLIGKLDTMTEKLSQELVNMELDEDSERSEAWDLLATQSIASPYPYFFEAISWDYKGKEDKARECYANAMCNSAFPSTVWDFSYWQDLTSGELRAIARRLLPKEEEYRKYFHLSTYSCPHHYLNFDDDYLTAKAADTLVVLPTAVGAALMLYETAVQANPFNARNFAGASLLSVQNGDSVKAAYYLNEGLLIDPENKGLQTLLNVWKGGHK